MKCKPFRRAGQKSWVSCQMCYHFRSININHFTPNIFFNASQSDLSLVRREERDEPTSSQKLFSSRTMILIRAQTSINNFIWHWFFLIRMAFVNFSTLFQDSYWNSFWHLHRRLQRGVICALFFISATFWKLFMIFFFFSFFYALPTRSKKSLQNAKIGSNWIYFTQIDSRM